MKKIGKQNNISFLSPYSYTKSKENTKGFTLVELLVVITILAILGAIGFLSFQSYTVYSRDVTRLSNLNVLKSGLEIQYTKGGYFAEPDDYVKITASGTTIRKQGLFGKKALRTIRANTDASKDPLTGEYYDYITDDNLSEYQIVGYMEGDETSYKTPLLSKEGLGVVQASGTGYTMKTKGQDLGVVFSGSVEVHKNMTIGSSIDIRNPDGELTIKFDEGDEVTSSSGSELFSNVYNRSKALLKNKNLAKLDDSLVLYFDMETTTQSGGYEVLNDFSKYNHAGFCRDGTTKVNCGEGGPYITKTEGSIGKAMTFDGDDDNIIMDKDDFDLTGSNKITILLKVKPESYTDRVTGLGGHFFRYGGDTSDVIGFRFNTEGKVYSSIGKHSGESGIWSLFYSDFKIPLNKYFYISSLYDGDTGEQSIYSNGGIIGKDNKDNIIGSFIKSSTYVMIGDLSNLAETYKGEIDEIRVYNRVLSEKELKSSFSTSLNY